MILQRLSAAIRRQDWFQVIIEVLIVIVGIFIGLQVQAWYEARGDRELEAKYLTQMYEEVVDIEERYKDSIPRVAGRRDIMQGILDDYRENDEFSEFTHAQCNAIIVSHIHVNFIPALTTISELQSTGRSQVIQSEEINRLMVLHKNNEDFSDKFIANLKADGIPFAIKYPGLFDVSIPVTTSSGIPLDADVNNRCFLPTDDKKIDYKNSLVFNTGRYTSYTATLARQFNSLANLRRALEIELGINQ